MPISPTTRRGAQRDVGPRAVAGHACPEPTSTPSSGRTAPRTPPRRHRNGGQARRRSRRVEARLRAWRSAAARSEAEGERQIADDQPRAPRCRHDPAVAPQGQATHPRGRCGGTARPHDARPDGLRDAGSEARTRALRREGFFAIAAEGDAFPPTSTREAGRAAFFASCAATSAGPSSLLAAGCAHDVGTPCRVRARTRPTASEAGSAAGG